MNTWIFQTGTNMYIFKDEATKSRHQPVILLINAIRQAFDELQQLKSATA